MYIQNDFTADHSVLQLLECEFHSADYHTILDVVTGLKTAVALLEKVLYSNVRHHLVLCSLVPRPMLYLVA